MPDEQLRRILPGAYEKADEFQRLLNRLERAAHTRCVRPRNRSVGLASDLQDPESRLEMATADSIFAARREDEERSPTPNLDAEEGVRGLAGDRALTIAADVAERVLRLHAVFEGKLLELLGELDEIGIPMPRQALITEYADSSDGADPISTTASSGGQEAEPEDRGEGRRAVPTQTMITDYYGARGSQEWEAE